MERITPTLLFIIIINNLKKDVSFKLFHFWLNGFVFILLNIGRYYNNNQTIYDVIFVRKMCFLVTI